MDVGVWKKFQRRINMKEIIEYIDQLQKEADTGATDINVLFWVGTNTIKERLKGAEDEKE